MASHADGEGPDDRLTGRPSEEKIRSETGQPWDDWFRVLDEWGAPERTHRETAAHLEERDVPHWWAQTITVWYQRARGMRRKHEQADGFAIHVSKTIRVPVDRLFDAFVNAGSRRTWLTDGTMSLRTSQPGRSARFDWEDGSTRVNVAFVDKGAAKATVAVAHERLPGPEEAEAAKASWREWLSRLESVLEGSK